MLPSDFTARAPLNFFFSLNSLHYVQNSLALSLSPPLFSRKPQWCRRSGREVLGWTHVGLEEILCAPFCDVEKTVDLEWVDRAEWRPPMAMQPAGSVTLRLRFELRDPARLREKQNGSTHATIKLGH